MEYGMGWCMFVCVCVAFLERNKNVEKNVRRLCMAGQMYTFGVYT